MSDLHAPNAPRRPAGSRRRGGAGLAAAAALLTVAPFAAGCGAGFNQTSLAVRPNAGAGSTGGLKVNNVWVVVDPGTGAAQVIGAVANAGSAEDRVTGAVAAGVPARVAGGVSGDASACARTAVSAGTVVIPVGRSVSFGRPGCPQLSLLGGRFRPGRIAPVTLMFAQASPLTVNAQIKSDTGLFTEYRPLIAAASASPSASASAWASASSRVGAGATAGGSASAHASASASATPSASASASAAASASAGPSATR